MKVKVSAIGIMDMLKFKNLRQEREKMIEQAQALPLPKTDRVNQLAKIFHPEKQYLIIQQIIEENKDTKSFILAPDTQKGTTRIAPFKAGSYLNVSFVIDGSIASRVYSISSSPKEKCYKITVKRKPGGFLSNYLLDKVSVGDELTATEPAGHLTYSSIRDQKNVVAIAGGTGITPFLSMAQAIADNIEHFSLTILFGVRTQQDIVYKNEFDKIMSATSKVKVVYVLSEEKTEGFEHGFITADLIQKYLPKEGASIFAAGPVALCDFLDTELKKLNLPSKNIRIERTSDEIADTQQTTYSLKIHCKGQIETLTMNSSETVLTALERSGIAAKNRCRVGSCGFCRSRLIQGKYQATRNEHLRLADKEHNYFHSCCSYPLSDMEIEIY